MRILIVPVLAVVVSLGMAAPSTPGGLVVSDSATLETRESTCTAQSCSDACFEWVNGPGCMVLNYYCSDNRCVCTWVCVWKGFQPHVEMVPRESCEDVDACWP